MAASVKAAVAVVDEVIGSITAEDEKNRIEIENLAETLSLERSDQKAVPTVDWCMYNIGGFP